jgi:UDP-2-acetamido-3-amino-2,3-dideoxy-glucuronate N-acetyltransferase
MHISHTICPTSHIAPSATVAEPCHIGTGAILEANVIVEKNVHLGAASFIGRGSVIHENAKVGAKAAIGEGITIGVGAEILMGSVVKSSVPPNAIVEGNPANIIGYTTTLNHLNYKTLSDSGDLKDRKTTSVRGVTLHTFPLIKDLRGDLSFGEFGKNIPFIPKRYFLVFGVPNSEVRGEHAHRKCQQFLVCTSGSCSVVVDDGICREDIVLDQPNLGLFIPPMVWGIQYRYAPDTVLLVFASEFYHSEDYIRDYRKFLGEIQETSRNV